MQAAAAAAAAAATAAGGGATTQALRDRVAALLSAQEFDGEDPTAKAVADAAGYPPNMLGVRAAAQRVADLANRLGPEDSHTGALGTDGALSTLAAEVIFEQRAWAYGRGQPINRVTLATIGLPVREDPDLRRQLDQEGVLPLEPEDSPEYRSQAGSVEESVREEITRMGPYPRRGPSGWPNEAHVRRAIQAGLAMLRIIQTRTQNVPLTADAVNVVTVYGDVHADWRDGEGARAQVQARAQARTERQEGAERREERGEAAQESGDGEPSPMEDRASPPATSSPPGALTSQEPGPSDLERAAAEALAGTLAVQHLL